MPKKKHKKRHYECTNWECPYDGVKVAVGAPIPHACFCKARLITNRYTLVYDDDDDDDDDDYDDNVPFLVDEGPVVDFSCPSPTTNNSPRPAWDKSRRREMKKRARSPGGTLYCQICGEEIEVNDEGKEEWYSKSGKFHATSPNLDHYGKQPISPTVTGGVTGVKGDWIERQRALRADPTHMSKDTPERRTIERAVFNASPLRTTHMKCNCSRPKQ